MITYTRKTGKGDVKTIKNSRHKDAKTGAGFEIEVSPQMHKFESLEEATQSAGSQDNLLKFVNSAFEREQIAAVRMYFGGDSATEDSVRDKLEELPGTITIASTLERGRSETKVKAEKYDQLEQLLKGGDIEAALALLGK